MQRLLAIAGLTLRAAFRYRLELLLTVLLIGSVVVLPLILKHDGSARGFTQILMTYTLSVITALLGAATLWIACGTLAREVEECQIQMVVVKPVARWQIWLGKWLGIVALNALLLGGAGLAVYGLLQWKASQLSPEQQEILQNEVLVARASAKEPVPGMESMVDELLKERLKENAVAGMDQKFVRDQIRERVKAQLQLLRPGFMRVWALDLSRAMHLAGNRPFYVRAKFFTAEYRSSGTYRCVWELGPQDTPKVMQREISMAAETPVEFPIPSTVLDDKGILHIRCINADEMALLFPLEDGLEVLYHEGGFALNYVRGLAVILCWLGLLAALGLAASSFLSFPVASFVTMALLVVFFSTGTLKQVVEEGGISGVNHDTGVIDTPQLIDRAAVPLFKSVLRVIRLVQDFSPIDLLSTGRSITWGMLALAVTQIIVFMGGLLALVGITIFSRRELATAQNQA